MQNEDIEIELPSPCLNSLDTALQRLGMLASSTDSRRDYVDEIRRKTTSYLNMVQINTRYVSNVSIGFRVRPILPHVRYKPYTIRERHRTKSENNDAGGDKIDPSLTNNLVEVQTTGSSGECSEDVAQLKKAKSLESIIAENNADCVDLRNISIGNCPELEVVSNSIQNLRVAE